MPIFEKSSESSVTRAIISQFAKDMDEFAETDVIIIGGGPSGLMAARDLAMKDVKVLIVERNNYLGGGFWIGGFLMNTITVRAPAQKVLDELGGKYKLYEKGLYMTPGPLACSKLIASACESGVSILNMASFDDVVLREKNRVAGAVVNWTPVGALPRQITCVDPIALESKLVIDATGHDAYVIQSLEKRGLAKRIGEGGMWIEKSEDAVREHTGLPYPGGLVSGVGARSPATPPR